MELTYKLIENGYIILKDGVKWITQMDFIPYPGATIEESAQNHVNEILKENEAAANQKSEVEQMQEDNAMIAETLALALLEIEQLKSEISAVKGE